MSFSSLYWKKNKNLNLKCYHQKQTNLTAEESVVEIFRDCHEYLGVLHCSLANPLADDLTHRINYMDRNLRIWVIYRWLLSSWVRVCVCVCPLVNVTEGVRKSNPIHPSIHFLPRVAGGLEPIPAIFGREAGYTLDRSPVHPNPIQLNSIQTKICRK